MGKYVKIQWGSFIRFAGGAYDSNSYQILWRKNHNQRSQKKSCIFEILELKWIQIVNS